MVPIKISYQSHEIQFKDELDQKEKQLCNYYYIYSCNSNFSWYLKYIFNWITYIFYIPGGTSSFSTT